MNNIEQEMHIPNYSITAHSDLSMLVMAGQEGIGQTFNTKLTYAQCVEFIDIEDETIPERERLQRNADKLRVNAICEYLIKRNNTFFPGVILVVSQLDLTPLDIDFGSVKLYKAVLQAGTDRLMIDGQGRLSGITKALTVRPDLAEHHLDVKIVVVGTNKIRDSSKFVTQIFADLHLNLKRPNSSQSIWFDSETRLSCLANDIMDTTDQLGLPFAGGVAVNGKLSTGQIFTLANVSDFISIIVASSTSKKAVNSVLSEEDSYELYKVLIAQYIEKLYSVLPFAEIHNSDLGAWKQALNSNILTCAIGLKALAWVGRSIIEDALENGLSELNFAPLERIGELPICDKSNELWLKKGVFNKEIDGKIKIVKSSEKRLAAVICQSIRLLPAAELV
ncbi:hypothetical protein GCM10011607_11810 [Shewanella inventionis]|uniref:DGQHR domain-containing protein n=1 Tax=Shewanella inventionis TaxID=1738770 RepID=A0ABQ1IXN8_9GAMM|nr:DNA sulfur modification protein DndB [Shewanella inventionis]GGB52958.1 hypothetical protein GCM10011607_11810 [Shewanella inventionis]